MPHTPQRRFDLREFKAISRAISTYEDLNVLIDHMVEGIVRTFKIKGACIMLYDEAEGRFFRVGSYGISGNYFKTGPVILDGRDDDAFVKGEPVFIQDLQADPRVQHLQAAQMDTTRAMASFPIKSRQAVVGLLRLYHEDPIVLHHDDVDSICALALHLGLVIEENGLRNFLRLVGAAMHNLPPRMRGLI